MKRKARAVPPMLPREPLTKKALAAIEKFASIKAGDLPLHYFMVRHVLKAERMRRSDLYAWLEKQDYRWQPHIGCWVKKDKPD
ncbi:MAG: hypothetical protein KJ063_02490 [Anaerolineae bacterium]|nr:hypothetical protein [Anaerolineae bacterium]